MSSVIVFLVLAGLVGLLYFGRRPEPRHEVRPSYQEQIEVLDRPRRPTRPCFLWFGPTTRTPMPSSFAARWTTWIHTACCRSKKTARGCTFA